VVLVRKVVHLQEVQVAQAEEWVLLEALRPFIQLQQEQAFQVKVIQAVHQIMYSLTQLVAVVAEVLVEQVRLLLLVGVYQATHPQQILTQ
jgi:hypothetical protein